MKKIFFSLITLFLNSTCLLSAQTNSHINCLNLTNYTHEIEFEAVIIDTECDNPVAYDYAELEDPGSIYTMFNALPSPEFYLQFVVFTAFDEVIIGWDENCNLCTNTQTLWVYPTLLKKVEVLFDDVTNTIQINPK